MDFANRRPDRSTTTIIRSMGTERKETTLQTSNIQANKYTNTQLQIHNFTYMCVCVLPDKILVYYCNS